MLSFLSKIPIKFLNKKVKVDCVEELKMEKDLIKNKDILII